MPVVELSVVFDAKFELVFSGEGRRCSFASKRSVSAATIPPIEWPTRTVCTDGLTVGEGDAFATSMSMTLF